MNWYVFSGSLNLGLYSVCGKVYIDEDEKKWIGGVVIK